MPKYIITIAEEVLNPRRNGLVAVLREEPKSFLVERLNIETDKDIVAEVAELAKQNLLPLPKQEKAE